MMAKVQLRKYLQKTFRAVRTVSLSKIPCKTGEKRLTMPTAGLTMLTAHTPNSVSTKALQMRGLLTALTTLTLIRSLVLNEVIGRATPCATTISGRRSGIMRSRKTKAMRRRAA